MWLHCKKHPLDSSRQVLRQAKELLLEELKKAGGKDSLFNVNAMHKCHEGISLAERRKLIFGSDQIKP